MLLRATEFFSPAICWVSPLHHAHCFLRQTHSCKPTCYDAPPCALASSSRLKLFFRFLTPVESGISRQCLFALPEMFYFRYTRHAPTPRCTLSSARIPAHCALSLSTTVGAMCQCFLSDPPIRYLLIPTFYAEIHQARRVLLCAMVAGIKPLSLKHQHTPACLYFYGPTTKSL